MTARVMGSAADFGAGKNKSAAAEPVAEEVLQVWYRVDLFDRRFNVVFDPAISYGFAVEQDIAGAPIAVARLAD